MSNSLFSRNYSVVSGFNPVTKLTDTHLSSMISAEGIETPITTGLYRCEGQLALNDQPCRLVWTRWEQAKDCASRGHRNQYRQTYSFKDGTTKQFIRQAVRRDGPRPVTQTVTVQAPSPEPAQPAQAQSLESVKAMALALGYRLSKIPAVKAPVTPAPVLEDDVFGDELFETQAA